MKLPNAPLVEVVFELRWHVHQGGDGFGFDPAFLQFDDAFAKAVRADGFVVRETLAQPGPTIPYQIVQRYRQANKPFPLLQTGHGIAACNMSTEYEWKDFERLVSRITAVVWESYPVTAISSLVPIHLELRYIDAFSDPLVSGVSLVDFLNSHTTFSLGLPSFFASSDLYRERALGQLTLNIPSRDPNLGNFEVIFNTATSPTLNKPGILMTNRVFRAGFQSSTGDVNASAVVEWLSRAHSMTSAFFKDVMTPEAMALFHQKGVG